MHTQSYGRIQRLIVRSCVGCFHARILVEHIGRVNCNFSYVEKPFDACCSHFRYSTFRLLEINRLVKQCTKFERASLPKQVLAVAKKAKDLYTC